MEGWRGRGGEGGGGRRGEKGVVVRRRAERGGEEVDWDRLQAEQVQLHRSPSMIGFRAG